MKIPSHNWKIDHFTTEIGDKCRCSSKIMPKILTANSLAIWMAIGFLVDLKVKELKRSKSLDGA
jgi:hypothetical protein